MKEILYTYDKETLQIKRTNKYNRLQNICALLIGVIILLFGILGTIILYDYKEIVHLQNTIQEKDGQIEEIQNICNYENIVKYKAGEYAMHPHKLVNIIDDTSVVNVLVELSAWYPDLKMAQIKCESGFGTSVLAKKSNNICGMRKTSSRETTQIKNQDINGYGVYNNWESCIVDMVLWDRAIFGNRKPTREEYIRRINAIYSETEGYGKTIDNMSKNYKQLF